MSKVRKPTRVPAEPAINGHNGELDSLEFMKASSAP